MKILFLHHWTSAVGGRKPTFLIRHGHEIINPALPDDDFDESVRIAEGIGGSLLRPRNKGSLVPAVHVAGIEKAHKGKLRIPTLVWQTFRERREQKHETNGMADGLSFSAKRARFLGNRALHSDDTLRSG